MDTIMPYMGRFVSYKLEIARIPPDISNIPPFICRELSLLLLLLLLLYALYIIRSQVGRLLKSRLSFSNDETNRETGTKSLRLRATVALDGYTIRC